MIGIVGGGISGLAVARGLARSGVPHVVLESRKEVGGAIRTVTVDGLPLDVGPQRIRLTPGVRALVEAAGMEGEIVRAREGLPLWMVRGGRLRRVPFRPSEALRTDLLGFPGKLRILLEPLTGPARPDETVAAYLTRKFGREAYENLLGPLYGGLYASDPGQMYARHALRRTLEHFGVDGSLLLEMLRRNGRGGRAPRSVTFRDGLQALPRALAGSEGVHVRTSTAVRALRKRESGGWSLEVDAPGAPGARSGAVAADEVVLCCPSGAAATILGPTAPDATRRLGTLTLNRLAVVHLRSDFEGEGLGYQVAFGEGLETRGCTWNASIFGRPGLFTCYLGGMQRPELPDWPDERIEEVARREFEQVTGSDAEVLHVARTGLPAWDRTWDALGALELPAGIHVCTNWSARPGVPGRVAQAARVVARLTGRPGGP